MQGQDEHHPVHIEYEQHTVHDRPGDQQCQHHRLDHGDEEQAIHHRRLRPRVRDRDGTLGHAVPPPPYPQPETVQGTHLVPDEPAHTHFARLSATRAAMAAITRRTTSACAGA